MLNVTEISKFLYDCKKKFLSFPRLNISLKFLDVEEEHCFVNISVHTPIQTCEEGQRFVLLTARDGN